MQIFPYLQGNYLATEIDKGEDWDIIYITTVSKQVPPPPEHKKTVLRAAGALHPRPQTVQDEAFQRGEFFDPNDIVQVKYEMLRRHRVDNRPITDVARNFGTSRQAFYATQAIFDTQGIPGLIPRRRGPRSAHKCTDEVLDFAQKWKDGHPEERPELLLAAIQQQFHISINPRSIDRALARRKKKRMPSSTEKPQ
jgi:hypothetical protein